MFNFPQLLDELLGDDKEEFFEFLSIVLDDIRGMNIDRISHYTQYIITLKLDEERDIVRYFPFVKPMLLIVSYNYLVDNPKNQAFLCANNCVIV